MKLVTKEQMEKLLANGRRMIEEDISCEVWPVVKLFTPDANATWLLAWVEPMNTDIAWGLGDLGYPEIGSVRLGEIAAVRGPLGLPVERDMYFTAEKSLSEYAADAHNLEVITRCGRICVAPDAGPCRSWVGWLMAWAMWPRRSARSVPLRPGTMAVVFFQQRGDVETFELGGLDEVQQRLQLLRLHAGEPMQIVLADPVQHPLHHGQVADPDLALVLRGWGGWFCFRHGGDPFAW